MKANADGPEAEAITTIRSRDANCYLVAAGGGFVLVDTGYPTERATLLDALQAAGCGPDELRLVVLTHGDIDHAGNCAYLQQVYGVPIAMHPADAVLVEEGIQPKKECPSPFIRVLLGMAALLQRGVSMEDFERFKPDIHVDEGFVLSEWGLDARVVHTPGHTSGSICVVTSDGALFSGDTLMNARKRLIVSGWAEDHEELGSSIELLMTLPVDIVYPGHLKPFGMEEFRRKNR
jgi:glyoxylase-like metal-dependent hydrolase (beta-lactamase superfamily II)